MRPRCAGRANGPAGSRGWEGCRPLVLATARSIFQYTRVPKTYRAAAFDSSFRETMNRKRLNGRVAIVACLAYIAPQDRFRHFTGDIHHATPQLPQDGGRGRGAGRDWALPPWRRQ